MRRRSLSVIMLILLIISSIPVASSNETGGGYVQIDAASTAAVDIGVNDTSGSANDAGADVAVLAFDSSTET